MDVGGFVMERRMMQGIKEWAEGHLHCFRLSDPPTEARLLRPERTHEQESDVMTNASQCIALGSRDAAFTRQEAAHLAGQSHLTGWRVPQGPLWLTIEGVTL
jgi:hypothetical protein